MKQKTIGFIRFRSAALFKNQESYEYGIDRMNICKADAIAQLSKWYNAATKVRVMYRSVTGNTSIVGRMSELSPSSVKITGDGCEMLLYFRETSEYEYNDARKGQTNKYPVFIEVRFSNGDHLEISECPATSGDISPS